MRHPLEIAPQSSASAHGYDVERSHSATRRRIRVLGHLDETRSIRPTHLVWVVASWVPQLRGHSALRWIGRICEPLLRPVRRLLPISGGIDISPMIVLLGLQLLARWLQRAPF